LKKGKAVKEKNLQPPLFFFPKKLVIYLCPSPFPSLYLIVNKILRIVIADYGTLTLKARLATFTGLNSELAIFIGFYGIM